jgi:3-oxoacyl-[acyl-carrier protein] reductase
MTAPVSLVTGASRGIGRGIALELAKLGHRVVINYASNDGAAKECQELVAKNGAESILVRADISIPEDRIRLLDD